MNHNDTWPFDGGPYYRETFTYLQSHKHHLIVEPWNAYSSLFFILAGLWILAFLKRKKISFPLLQYGFIPLMIVGGIGSTLYHAFRSSPWLMWMDVLPMFILTLLMSFYLWQKVLKNTWLTLTILGGFILLRSMTFYLHLPMQTAINLSYAVVGIALLLPVIWIWVQTRFALSAYLLSSFVFMALSFFFRWYDDVFLQWPMGVHWLWHIFSSIAAIFAILYLVKLETYESFNTNK